MQMYLDIMKDVAELILRCQDDNVKITFLAKERS